MHAQPVSFQLKLEVPAGQKPQIRITGATQVTGVKLELERDDGKHFTLEQRSLARNQAVTLSVGDGAAGQGELQGHDLDAATGVERSDRIRHRRAPTLKVGYDAEHLDLDKRVLQFTLSRPAGTATLTAIGEDGSTLGEGAGRTSARRAGTWLADHLEAARERARADAEAPRGVERCRRRRRRARAVVGDDRSRGRQRSRPTAP